MVFIGPTPGLPIPTRMTFAARDRSPRQCDEKHTILRCDYDHLLIELKTGHAARHLACKYRPAPDAPGDDRTRRRASRRAIYRVLRTAARRSAALMVFGVRPRIVIFEMIARAATATTARTNPTTRARIHPHVQGPDRGASAPTAAPPGPKASPAPASSSVARIHSANRSRCASASRNPRSMSSLANSASKSR